MEAPQNNFILFSVKRGEENIEFWCKPDKTVNQISSMIKDLDKMNRPMILFGNGDVLCLALTVDDIKNEKLVSYPSNDVIFISDKEIDKILHLNDIAEL